MVKEDNSKLENLKDAYKVIQKKYKLPSFRDMNEDFHIEKIAESETELIISEVRKFVADKLANYMRFVENLLNPVNVPMFIFSFVKALDTHDKKTLEEIYKGLLKMELSFIELDLEFKEEKEANFIIDSFKFWQDIKQEMLNIMNRIRMKWDEKGENSNKGYFG